MRVIQSFERRLQGAVGNTFARLFGGKVQPAEVADALQQEAAEHVQHQGNVTIAPNHYRVRLGPTDRQGLGADEASVASALSDMIREYLDEQGWQTFGDVAVSLEQSESLHTGQFRISSIVDPDVGRRSPQHQDRTEGRSGTHDPAARRLRPIRSRQDSRRAARIHGAYDQRPGDQRPADQGQQYGPPGYGQYGPPDQGHQQGGSAGRLPRPASGQPRIPAAAVRRARLRPAGLGPAGPALGAAVRPAATAAGLPAAAAALPAGPSPQWDQRIPAGLRPAAGCQYGGQQYHAELRPELRRAGGRPAGDHRHPVDRRRVRPQPPAAARLERHRPRAGRRRSGSPTPRSPAGMSMSTSTARSAVLHDLGSTNGTTVNGSSVQTWQLADGDVIHIGHSTVVFSSRY